MNTCWMICLPRDLTGTANEVCRVFDSEPTYEVLAQNWNDMLYWNPGGHELAPTFSEATFEQPIPEIKLYTAGDFYLRVELHPLRSGCQPKPALWETSESRYLAAAALDMTKAGFQAIVQASQPIMSPGTFGNTVGLLYREASATYDRLQRAQRSH